MPKQSKFVKTKIITGYILMVAAAVFASAYIYREMLDIARIDRSDVELQQRRNLITQTLYHLYQTESSGQLVLAGYSSYDRLYSRELGLVRRDIDSLKCIALVSADSLQVQRIDSISRLLNVKASTIFSLRRNVRDANAEPLYNEQIERIIEAQRAIVPDTIVRREIIVQRDTSKVVNQPEKKGFFQRLAGLFSTPEPDTSVVVRAAVEIKSDTIPYQPADSIEIMLRDLQTKVNSQRQASFDLAWADANRLSYSTQVVTRKIYQLLMDFENKEVELIMARMAKQQQAKRHATDMLGGIAIAAVVLTLFFVSLLWRDINRSNRYRRELEEANRFAEELLRARERLMLTITHDIKAPLSSVIGYIDLLSRLVEDKRQQVYLKNMQASSAHLLDLVKQLLDFHRLESRKMDLRSVQFNPHQLFDAIAMGITPVAEEHGIEFRYCADENTDTELLGDPFRIRQIADNLLSNAVKFTDRGHVSLNVRMEGQNLCFSVTDTGRGIAPGEREKIFQEFVRLPSAQGVEGFGIGLSITRRLVELLGGNLSLESETGRGSTFAVCLPVTPCTGIAPQQAAGDIAVAGAAGISCLVVDDDTLQLELMGSMCSRLGVQAEFCDMPQTALEIAKKRHFDIIFTDLQMPGMDGFALRERLHRLRKLRDTPIVAVSARSDSNREYLKSKGFATSLNKPFGLNDLARSINYVMGNGSEEAAAPSPKQDAGQQSADTGQAPDSQPGNTTDPDKSTGITGDTQLQTSPEPDFTAMTMYAGDDTDAASEILRSFAEQTSHNLGILTEACSQGDIATAQAVAHKMLPAMRMIKATAAANLLEAIETHKGPITPEMTESIRQVAPLIGAVIEKAKKEVTLPPEQKQKTDTE